MHKQIFVNLPVRDLDRSVRFFGALGYAFDPAFTNENATCMIVGENLFAMLLVEPFFQGFIGERRIADTRTHSEVLVCLSADSREEIDRLVARAIDAGGRAHGEPKDHGFMYGHGFVDPDGHIWELVHMTGVPQS
ncbi:VOC family protein [Coralloluteibacterium thermophilus]|uniref:VOC family protein n=1 Tax=Coralloluteibacterium thermophilum TaxID=2707049 RepID=A0ABV9NMZ5_9GAMM